jgi:hypothetical protein
MAEKPEKPKTREPIKIIFEVIWTKREDDPARYERFKRRLVRMVERHQASQPSQQEDAA